MSLHLTVLLTPQFSGVVFVGTVTMCLAAALFSLTVVSFPLVLDRDVDFVTAMITSLRAVAAAPVPMLGWEIGRAHV